MKIHYQFAELSRAEKRLHEFVLLEEMERQVWFAVAFSKKVGGETFVALQ